MAQAHFTCTVALTGLGPFSALVNAVLLAEEMAEDRPWDADAKKLVKLLTKARDGMDIYPDYGDSDL